MDALLLSVLMSDTQATLELEVLGDRGDAFLGYKKGLPGLLF